MYKPAKNDGLVSSSQAAPTNQSPKSMAPVNAAMHLYKYNSRCCTNPLNTLALSLDANARPAVSDQPRSAPQTPLPLLHNLPSLLQPKLPAPIRLLVVIPIMMQRHTIELFERIRNLTAWGIQSRIERNALHLRRRHLPALILAGHNGAVWVAEID